MARAWVDSRRRRHTQRYAPLPKLRLSAYHAVHALAQSAGAHVYVCTPGTASEDAEDAED